MRAVVLLFILFCLFSCINESASDKIALATNHVSGTSEILDELSKRAIKDMAIIALDSMAIPRTTSTDGSLEGHPSKNWTSGFYPGLLWQLYGHSADERLKNAAIQWSSFVEKEKLDYGTHDLGFKIYCSFGNAFKLTQEEEYKNIILTAAQTLSTRFNSVVGAIRSWDHHTHLWAYPVIIDNMMNLELLFEATRLSGDSIYYHIAETHANTTLKNHFRSDNSSYHVVDYDVSTGEVVKKNTHQGLNHESDWSRGQAWGLYGYTTAFRYTRNKKYLEQAKNIAAFIFSHPNLPKDLIPYWDYDAPNIPNEPRDVSAASITASALFELAKYDSKNANQYFSWANHILYNLNTDRYRCDIPPFFLKHSVGSIPGKFEMDNPIIYADYYYVEALLRKKKMNI